jgi:hypothetical protein
MLEDKINSVKLGIATTFISVGLYSSGCATIQKGAKDVYAEMRCQETYGPASEKCNSDSYPIAIINFDLIPDH